MNAHIRSMPSTDLPDQRAALSVALWLFIAVASALFSLFFAAYVMRMKASDWAMLAMPWQLWLSSAFLIGASLFLQRAKLATHAMEIRMNLLQVGGCGTAFLLVQVWAWQELAGQQVQLAGNPAASFFYLLTAMHGVHVLGGLVLYGLTLSQVWQNDAASKLAWQVSLCARYWHFLLAVWVLLFATLGWLTPELVIAICGGS